MNWIMIQAIGVIIFALIMGILLGSGIQRNKYRKEMKALYHELEEQGKNTITMTNQVQPDVFGALLEMRRQDLDLSRMKAAEEIGTSTGVIRDIESGRNDYTSWQKAVRYAQQLGFGRIIIILNE